MDYPTLEIFPVIETPDIIDIPLPLKVPEIFRIPLPALPEVIWPSSIPS